MRNSSSISWRVGTCGISDRDWIVNFYPKGLRSVDWLGHYASRFNSIELNTTFHVVPERWKVQRWASVTPSDFRFSVKFPKELTHGPPDLLLESHALDFAKSFLDIIHELGEKLSVILLQFPREFSGVHHSTLFKFLDRISCPARLAIEFRNMSWWTPITKAALRERKIGCVTTDRGNYSVIAAVPGKGQLLSLGLQPIVSTTDFLYVRWLGRHGQFPVHIREYFDATPRTNWWFDRLAHVVESDLNIRQVYAFFDNDFSGHAPNAARRFADKVNLPCVFETPASSKQPRLFH